MSRVGVRPRPSEQELVEALKRYGSINAVAREMGLPRATAYGWFSLLKAPRREPNEAAGGLKAERHPVSYRDALPPEKWPIAERFVRVATWMIKQAREKGLRPDGDHLLAGCRRLCEAMERTEMEFAPPSRLASEVAGDG